MTLEKENVIENVIEEEDYINNPDVCPSSLGEDDKPMTEGETAHKWDETQNPVTCAECGAERDK